MATAAYTSLGAARDAFATIAGVVSCKVGIEPNISPADYPMIRVVPPRITPGRPYSGRTIEAQVFFGVPLTTSEGLEDVYGALFELEAAILVKIKALSGRYIETLTDEDRLDAYKLMVVRCELPSPEQPAVTAVLTGASVPMVLSGTPAALAPLTALTATTLDDWTVDAAAGSLTRELNGQASTRTRATVSGTVAGADGSVVYVGLYTAGVQFGNVLMIATTGTDEPIAFSHTESLTAAAPAEIDVRATGTAGAYTFASVRLECVKD